MERRLAAIVAADLVGYSKLMGEDEAGTLSALSRLTKDLIEPLITEHHGRIVKLMGDGILAEFASVVDAVTCAIAWQERIAASGDGLRFRIGINLGDVIVQDGDIFGNGVNVAARLEGLADPGGICLSDMVLGEVKNKLDLAFEDLGEQTVKKNDRHLRHAGARFEQKTFLIEIRPSVGAIEVADAQTGNIFRFRHVAVHRHPGMRLGAEALPMGRAATDFARDEGECSITPDVADDVVGSIRHCNPVNLIVRPQPSGAGAIGAIAAR